MTVTMTVYELIFFAQLEHKMRCLFASVRVFGHVCDLRTGWGLGLGQFTHRQLQASCSSPPPSYALTHHRPLLTVTDRY